MNRNIRTNMHVFHISSIVKIQGFDSLNHCSRFMKTKNRVKIRSALKQTKQSRGKDDDPKVIQQVYIIS